jgi:hypothetical protein
MRRRIDASAIIVVSMVLSPVKLWKDMKESGIVPSIVKDGLPIVHEAVGSGVAVELCGHRLNDEPDVDWEGFKGTFSNLIGKGTLVDEHGCLNFRVTVGGMASYHDCHEVPRDEAHFLNFVHDLGSLMGEKERYMIALA